MPLAAGKAQAAEQNPPSKKSRDSSAIKKEVKEAVCVCVHVFEAGCCFQCPLLIWCLDATYIVDTSSKTGWRHRLRAVHHREHGQDHRALSDGPVAVVSVAYTIS